MLIQANPDRSFTIPAHMEWRAMGNALLFEPGEGCPEKFTLGLEFSDADQQVIYAQEIPVETLPSRPLLAAKPKFKLNSWYGYPLARIVPENGEKGRLPRKLLQSWADAGFSGARGVTVGSWDLFAECSSVLPWRAAQDRSMPALRTVGGTDGVLLCPSALIAAGKDYFAGKLKASAIFPELLKGKPACIDYEPYCFGWVTNGCFCKACREAFRKDMKLEKCPGMRTILTKYEKEWIEFRCRQRAELIKAMADALHETAPESKFYFCSMPSAASGEEEEYAKLYGITPRLYEDFVDVFLPMNYVPSILFYQRLQQDALTLRKPVQPVLDNGWGGTFSGYYPARLAMQIVSTAFCNLPEAYVGTGLLRMDSEYHLAVREAMRTILLLERADLTGKLIADAPLRVALSEIGKNYFHLFTRQLAGGGYLLMLVNNNPDSPLFIRLAAEKGFPGKQVYLSDPLSGRALSPDGKSTVWTREALKRGFDLELAPLQYRFILISDRIAGDPEIEDMRSYTAGRKTRENELRKVAEPKQGYGMSFEVKDSQVRLTAPAETLTVDLQSGGAALWNVRGKAVATLGADAMVEPVPFQFGDLSFRIIDSSLDEKSVSVTVSCTLRHAAYAGLEVRKSYILRRDQNTVEVKVAVSPTKGYRPFRYKFFNLLHFAQPSRTAPYGGLFGLRVPDGETVKQDVQPRHMAFCRPGRVLSETYRSYVPRPGSFRGDWCESFEIAQPENFLRARFKDVDEVIVWRGGKEATLEMVCMDAYPDRDPHKARTWHGSYTLEYQPNK